MNRAKSVLTKIIVLCLALAIIIPVNSHATNNADTSRASRYLNAYNTYIHDAGNGNIQVWYEVIGTGDMDEIGTLSIDLYEVNSNGSLTFVKSFLHENYDTMLSYDDWYHYSHVTYQGSSSKTYKAYVCIWAGKNGSGDTRYMWATE